MSLENRGRGGRAGANIGGKARPPGPHVARGNPDSLHPAPPDPSRRPHSPPSPPPPKPNSGCVSLRIIRSHEPVQRVRARADADGPVALRADDRSDRPLPTPIVQRTISPSAGRPPPPSRPSGLRHGARPPSVTTPTTCGCKLFSPGRSGSGQPGTLDGVLRSGEAGGGERLFRMRARTCALVCADCIVQRRHAGRGPRGGVRHRPCRRRPPLACSRYGRRSTSSSRATMR